VPDHHTQKLVLKGTETEPIYGAVTIGGLWKLLAMTGTTVRIGSRSYHVERPPKIPGILRCLVTDG
jgi:hypothetical protein